MTGLVKHVTSRATTAARVAIAAAISYQAILIVLIFLRPDLDPSWHTISEWAIGPYGWMMSMAFLVSAISYAALLLMLKPQIRGTMGRVGLALLMICVVGTVGVGVFTTDPLPLTRLTVTGALHTGFGSAALILLPFGALLLNLNLAFRNEAWLPARRVLLWTCGLPLFGFTGFVAYTAIFVMPLGRDAYGPGVNIGWPPRFAFLMYMIWLVSLARAGMKIDKASSSGAGARNDQRHIVGLPTMAKSFYAN